MTADTSRAAVEALITEWHNSKGKSGYTGRGDRLADALAALLDERDAAEEKYRSWLADRNRQQERADDAEQRIRDLEATVDNLRLISNANGDWNIKYQEVNHRAERAEEQLQAIREVVTGWNGFTGLTREVLAILDTNEPKGDDDDHRHKP